MLFGYVIEAVWRYISAIAAASVAAVVVWRLGGNWNDWSATWLLIFSLWLMASWRERR